jgi:hypothetical protein
MNTKVLVWAAVFTTGCFLQGAEFPLTFKSLSFSEAQTCPGGYGMFGSIQKSLRSQVKAEPKAVSAYPLYGQLNSSDGKSMVFRLDESKGDRNGYDRLIIDLNQNGDLQDDPVISKRTEENSPANNNFERAVFGPIDAPADRSIGSWRPTFYVEMSLYNKNQIYAKASENDYFGSLRAFSGWILEATVEVNGIKQKIALKDGNCNFRLGDQAMVSKIIRRSGDKGRWYLGVQDYLLRDLNNSGRYERSPLVDESEGLSSLVSFGAKLYQVSWAKDFKSISLDPYTGALAELKLNDKVTSMRLAREVTTDKWEPVTPEVNQGKTFLPPGNYRLISYVLTGKDAQGALISGQTDEVGDDTITLKADQSQALNYGLPMDLKVDYSKETGQGQSGGLMAAARSLFGGAPTGKSFSLQMNVSISGVGGEKYSRFYKVQPNQPNQFSLVSPPQFKILDASGNLLASGKFEFG